MTDRRKARTRSPGPGTACSVGSATARSRRSRSSTALRSAAASRWRCTAPTARCHAARAGDSACPECFLGLVPGWGGAYLLPNLIGADAAVTVIIENALNQNRMLTGPQAAELGIADAMFEPADFLEQSLRWAAQVRPRRRRRRAPSSTATSRPGTAAVARGRAIADAKVHGAAPAPYRALDLIDAARANGQSRRGLRRRGRGARPS